MLLSVVDARHREDVGAVIDFGQLVVGEVPEETHRQVGHRTAAAARSGLLVVALALAADDPVLEPAPDLGREHLQRPKREQLALARMQAADREDDDLVPRTGRGRTAPQRSPTAAPPG